MRSQKNHSLWFMFCTTLLIQCTATRASLSEAAAYPIIRTATTITSSGPYRVIADISGQITISASDVTLDLNNHTITGGTHCIAISSNQSNIVIANGTLKSASSHGIDIAANCSKISLKNIHFDQCDKGIYATTSTDIMIKECLFTNNTNDGIKLTSCTDCDISSCNAQSNKIGFFLDQTNTSHVTNTVATACTQEGFSLSSAEKNSLYRCKALNIGATSTGDSFGFSTDNGSENSFLQCVAEGITTTATAESNVIAGFALKGTEQASSIMQCVISDIQTSTSNQTVPYGIIAETTLQTPVLKDSVTWGMEVRDIKWAPSGLLFAVCGNTSSSRETSAYQFDRTTEKLTEIANFSTGNAEVHGLAWGRSGTLLAIAAKEATGPDNVLVYSVEPETGELSLAGSHTPTGGAGMIMDSISWAPNERLLATGGEQMSSNSLFLYYFDPVANILTLRKSVNVGARVYSVAWSPTYNFVAAGGVIATGSEIRLYEFDAKSKLTLRNSKSHAGTVHAVSWSPDGTYLAIGGGPGTGSFDTRVYELDATAKTLTLRDSATHGGTVYATDWSPDGKHLVTGGATVTGNEVRIYSFSHTTKTLTLQHSIAHGLQVNGVSWSPDGVYLALAGQVTGSVTHRVYSVLSSPDKCVVRENTVHNVKGAVGNRGVGINIPSVGNLVVKNITHDNDHNYQSNTRISHKIDPEELLNYTS